MVKAILETLGLYTNGKIYHVEEPEDRKDVRHLRVVMAICLLMLHVAVLLAAQSIWMMGAAALLCVTVFWTDESNPTKQFWWKMICGTVQSSARLTVTQPTSSTTRTSRRSARRFFRLPRTASVRGFVILI